MCVCQTDKPAVANRTTSSGARGPSKVHAPSVSRISSGVTHGATRREGRVAAYSSIACVAASQAERQASSGSSSAELGASTNKSVRRGGSSAPPGFRRRGSNQPMLHRQAAHVLYDRLVSSGETPSHHV